MYYYYELFDNEDTYGVIRILEVKERKFIKLVNQYKKEDPDEFNIDDLVEFLRKKEYQVFLLNVKPIYF